MQKADLLGFINIHFVAKYQKTRKVLNKKILKKVAQCRKNRKGDPSVSSGFVGYIKKSF